MTTANPYAAPTADDIGAAAAGTYQPKVFSFAGRIGRLRYLAYSLAWGVAAAVISALVGALFGLGDNPVLVILGSLISIPITLVPAFALAVRRLNDLDHSGWWSLLLLLPFINLAFAIYTIFWPGSSAGNRFGAPPVPNTTPVIVAALVFPVLMIIFAVMVAVAFNMGMSTAFEANHYDFEYYAE